MYGVISKMLPCHHHDINSEPNRCTSPTSIFALQTWGYQKKRQVKGLPKCRTRVIWILNWVPSSHPSTEREKNVKRCRFASSSWLHTGNSECPCFLSLSFHTLSRGSAISLRLSCTIHPVNILHYLTCHPQLCHRWKNCRWTLYLIQELGHSGKSQWSFQDLKYKMYAYLGTWRADLFISSYCLWSWSWVYESVTSARPGPLSCNLAKNT